MNQNRNYQKELNALLLKLQEEEAKAGGGPGKTLLLHSCCAPCSSYVLEYLRQYFEITVFYYNPNISEAAEYRKRMEEQKRLIRRMNEEQPCRIHVIEGDYEPNRFLELARGLEDCPEGGERCFLCYELRLGRTAELALEGGYDYFTTTLSISPLKNAHKLNEIGERLAGEYGVSYLPSDFKKKNGYQRSVELSAEYGLYRQDYCGCIYSRASRARKGEKEGAAWKAAGLALKDSGCGKEQGFV